MKFSLFRLTILFLFVILFPLVQNQWLNLYLFDVSNFTIYKFLYYLSGLICPIIVFINSLNKFTYYKFPNRNINNDFVLTGKGLFFLILLIIILLSGLIFNYFFINYNLLFNALISNYKYIAHLDINKQVLFVFIISILLIIKKIKLVIKKIILINFFITSVIIWYIQLNNILLNDLLLFNIFKFDNINFINILFLVSIDIFYYIWSYVSHGSYISDWKLPVKFKNDIKPIFSITTFYLLIIIYYSSILK